MSDKVRRQSQAESICMRYGIDLTYLCHTDKISVVHYNSFSVTDKQLLYILHVLVT